jgi:DNA-binding XRE family transcriptional regulator
MSKKKRVVPGFGDRLRKLRVDRGLSQIALAEAVDTNQQTICAYEKGHAVPSLPIVIDLARILHVSIDVLAGRKTTKTLPEMDMATYRLWNKIRQVRGLPERKRRSVIEMINSALESQEMAQSGTGPTTTPHSARSRRTATT